MSDELGMLISKCVAKAIHRCHTGECLVPNADRGARTSASATCRDPEHPGSQLPVEGAAAQDGRDTLMIPSTSLPFRYLPYYLFAILFAIGSR